MRVCDNGCDDTILSFSLCVRIGGPDPFVGSTAVIPKKHRVRQDNQEGSSHPGVNTIGSKDDSGRAQRMSLSNSWPDSGFEEAPRGKKPRDPRYG